MAAQNGHVKIVQMLLAAGADPTIVSDYGPSVRSATPFEAARAAGHAEVVRVLEEAMKAKR
jgi:ankyrin repeat protein